MQDIEQEVVRLNRIVSEVLDYAKPITLRVADGRPERGVPRGGAGVRRSPSRPSASPWPSSPGSTPIVTDADRLRTVLVNVLANAGQAVRAARDAAAADATLDRPGVELSTAARGDGGVRITVRDQGGGIDPALLARVFEPYFTTRRAGTGLGLAIARNIVEGLGGTIDDPERADGHRAAHRRSRRRMPPARPRRAVTQGATLMATSGTILIADDEERILKALGRALREDGHDVVEAGSGRAAQRLLAERTFDVLVIDNIMPDVTGLDLIRDVALHGSPAERPQMVLMTAHATIESAIEAMKLGALDYLQKPFDIDELLVVVRRAVELAAPAEPAPLPAERARRGVRPLRHRRAQPRRCRTSSGRWSASPRPRARC